MLVIWFAVSFLVGILAGDWHRSTRHPIERRVAGVTASVSGISAVLALLVMVVPPTVRILVT